MIPVALPIIQDQTPQIRNKFGEKVLVPEWEGVGSIDEDVYVHISDMVQREALRFIIV